MNASCMIRRWKWCSSKSKKHQSALEEAAEKELLRPSVRRRDRCSRTLPEPLPVQVRARTASPSRASTRSHRRFPADFPRTRFRAPPLRGRDRESADPCRLELIAAHYLSVPGASSDRTDFRFNSLRAATAPPLRASLFARRRASSTCRLAVMIPTIDHPLSR